MRDFRISYSVDAPKKPIEGLKKAHSGSVENLPARKPPRSQVTRN